MSKMTFSESSNQPYFSEKIGKTNKGVWKIIISDDEEQVHEITKLALTHFVFEGKKLEFISAFSGLMSSNVME